MKRAFSLCLMLIATGGAGCSQLFNNSKSPADAESIFVGGDCEVLDYGIREFNLLSSIPVISNTYDINISIEQLGDCKANDLKVAFFENGILMSEYDIAEPEAMTHLNWEWIPKCDTAAELMAQIQIMDTDVKNNSETIKVTGYPIGNYMRITDLTSDKIDAGVTYAEVFSIQNRIKITEVQAYMAKSATIGSSTAVILKIFNDDAGKPGKVIFETEQKCDLSENFDWQSFPTDLKLEAGKYWIALTGKDGSALWHFSRKPHGGGIQEVSRPKYETNSSTMQMLAGEWQIVPEKNYSFKIHSH